MCGGGSPRATITQPDYSAFNQQFELQKSAIEQSMNSSIQSMQADYQSQLEDSTAFLRTIEQDRIFQAQDEAAIAEDARRLATLIGAPPPEKVAQAPKIGARDRGLDVAKGKKSLRIGKTATKTAKGAGLNIT